MENESTIICDKSSVSSSSSSSLNKVRSCYSSSNSLLTVSDGQHGRSKAQLCLQKIIAIILSGKEKRFEDNHEKKKKGLGFDLNLRLGTNDDNWVTSGVIGGGDNGESNVEFTSVVVSDRNCLGECDFKGLDVMEVGEQKEEAEEEERRELSEVTDLETPEIGDVKMVVEKREMKKNGEKGYMDLLVEAARLISGDFKDENHETDEEVENIKNRDEKTELKRRKSKRNRKLDVYEDISPVVKSKRGRNQVLPYRYRDSVLDPWKSTTGMRSLKRISIRSRLGFQLFTDNKK